MKSHSPRRPRVVVVGDLVVDVVIAPSRDVEAGTDVPGRVVLRAGGSAANAARWLGRLGAEVVFIGAVGRDAAGRALDAAVRTDRAVPRLVRVAGARTGRIGVLVAPGGERSFVADRGAADRLRPEDLRPAWFAGADLLHLPAYSLLGEPLGRAGMEAIRLARAAGALVSVDLASIGPLLAAGRGAALELLRGAAPDILFATAAEAAALLGADPDDGGAEPDAGAEAGHRGPAEVEPGAAEPWLAGLAALAPVAVIKRGGRGASVLARSQPPRPLRVDIPVRRVAATDTTAAGDAFDAGFIHAYLAGHAAGLDGEGLLRRAALAGHPAARRQHTARRPELPLL
jgi:ribokinase